MAIHSPQRKLTYQDFEQIPEDGQRHEILDGVHVVSPSPNALHQIVFGAAFVKLYVFVMEHGLGRVLSAPFDVVLSEHDIVEPDILFISSSRAEILTESHVQGAPDLVVEILSPSTRRRDLGKKLVRYDELGVQEYWVLEPEASTVLIFRREGDGFLSPILLSAEADDRLATPLLPGLEISLRAVFKR